VPVAEPTRAPATAIGEPVRTEPYLPPAKQPIRSVVWILHMALPMLGLWLLLAHPDPAATPGAVVLDVEWDHRPSHFWLILAVAGLNVALGAMISEAARRRADARLLLVSMVFLVSAGFFMLHGLATPGIILAKGSVGFDLGQPVGLTIASFFAFASALPLGERAAQAVLAAQRWIRGAAAAVLVVWGIWSLTPLPPLGDTPPQGGMSLGAYSLIGVVLFASAAALLFQRHRKRPSAMLISLVTAYALLAETMIAGIPHRSWHLSWWEWHILLTMAFALVAYSAYIQFRREGSSAGIFDSVALSATVRRVQAQYEQALEELVSHLRRRAESDVPVATRLAGKFHLTEGQAAVLDRAGTALASERELSERLGALVDVGRQARVGLPESELLAATVERVRRAYGDVRLGLISSGTMQPGPYGLRRPYDPRVLAAHGPLREGDVIAYPLTVKGRLAGVLEVPIGRTSQDEALAATLAGQLSITLENARLYKELETLFRQYMSPDVASALLADPDQAALGGSMVELTALFADLKGFTTFSERVTPGEIVEMLNRYHTAAVPCILAGGGTIVQFVGDALLALFNAPARQDHHARAAAQAALAMQEAADRVTEEVAWEQATGRLNGVEWPRFRVGINTGPALVGNIGSPELRGFNAMGDCVNVAARLQALAQPGTVVIGATTRDRLGRGAKVTPLGDLSLKGKEQPVRAFVLSALD
jgi:adenylate cyclase